MDVLAQTQSQFPQDFVSVVGRLERLWGTGIKYLFLLAASCNDLLFCARNPGALPFHCPRVSPGDQPLTKKPEDSRIEIGSCSTNPEHNERLVIVYLSGKQRHF